MEHSASHKRYVLKGTKSQYLEHPPRASETISCGFGGYSGQFLDVQNCKFLEEISLALMLYECKVPSAELFLWISNWKAISLRFKPASAMPDTVCHFSLLGLCDAITTISLNYCYFVICSSLWSCKQVLFCDFFTYPSNEKGKRDTTYCRTCYNK